MLKEHQTTFSFAQKLVDFIAVIFCWWLAYYIRFETIIPDAQTGLLTFYLKVSPILGIITFYFFRKYGLYRSHRFTSRFNEILTVIKANNIATIAFIIFVYFFFRDKVSRITFINYMIISNVVLISIRILIRNLLRMMRQKGRNLRYIMLVGDGIQLDGYVKHLKQFKDAGIKFSGWIDSNGKAEKFGIKEFNCSLSEAIEQMKLDSIVIGYSSKNSDKIEKVLMENYNETTPIQILPDMAYSYIGYEINDFGGIPIITINQPKVNNFDYFIKRVFDFSVTLTGTIIISPLLIILALLVKLTSRGPIFYGQERMGLDGKTFKMLKFRSMRVDAEQETGAVWAVENDPRRTKFGTFLRSTSLDELPQLFNVINGDMSLVGPRPERPVFVNKFKKEIPAYMLRHKMKAGITGWAQVNGWRGDTSLHKRIECDIYYIKNWSLLFDIKILFLTFWKGFINKNAY